jgi:hypothetical protein
LLQKGKYVLSPQKFTPSLLKRTIRVDTQASCEYIDAGFLSLFYVEKNHKGISASQGNIPLKYRPQPYVD